MRLIFILILFIPSINAFSATKKIKSRERLQDYNLEIMGKFSLKNQRHLGQAGILLPIHYKNKGLFYIPFYAMLDNKHNSEFNIGLGYRKIIQNRHFHGVYAFFDYRKVDSKNHFKQVTLGYEFFQKNLEVRGNIYIPESKLLQSFIPVSDSVTSNYNGHNTTFEIDRTNNVFQTKASKGLDLEFGLTKGISSGVYLAYYGFINQDNTTHGIRTRGNIRVLPWLSLEAEFSYDNSRKFTPYGGIRLNIPFTKNNQKALYNKMTSLPVRDVDIVTSLSYRKNVHTYSSKEIQGWAPLIKRFEGSAQGNNTFRNMKEVNKKVVDTGRKYRDIAAIFDSTKLVVFMQDFDGSDVLIQQGTIEFDVLENSRKYTDTNNQIRMRDASSNSSLDTMLEKGYWTSRIELENNKKAILILENKIKKYTVSSSLLEHFLKSGTSPSITQGALMWEFKDRDDVFVANFQGCIGDASKNNPNELAKALNSSKYTSKTRFIVMNFHHPKHAIGVTIDKKSKTIYYLESNGMQASPEAKAVLNTKFNGYKYVYSKNIQHERISCGTHAFYNTVMLIKHGEIPNKTWQHRHVLSIYKRMVLSSYAYSANL